MPKALIAMSGGVDSSVAAYLTLREGFECIGAMLRLFDNDVGKDYDLHSPLAQLQKTKARISK